MQLNATKLQEEQNKVLEHFTTKHCEKLATFADAILNDDGITTRLKEIDEQIRVLMDTRNRPGVALNFSLL